MFRSLAIAGVVSLLLFSGCVGPREAAVPDVVDPIVWPNTPPPSAEREFRAAWVATVANIDWPSRRGMPEDSLRMELEGLFDHAVDIGLNAIVLQVRPMADAFYPSRLEPWSIYLSGEQGVGPGFDPLAFAVEEAHQRGLELHAWFNPFRAAHPTNEGPYDSLHVTIRRPDWVHAYGQLVWMDPGIPEVRDHSLDVMLDVVRRYDVDGVHMDDYFYPYPVQDSVGAEVPFPDSVAFDASGYRGSLADWRRANVDTFVEALYDSVKAVKPAVKVGISPFGIWRPGFPEGIEGFDQYEGLYADARRWLREGWVDYFTPQLYWAMDSKGQPYGPLLDWWVQENIHSRHLWPGNYASRVILEGSAYWGPDELVRQVRHTRTVAGAAGNVFFSMRALMPGLGVDEMLVDSVYASPALTPETSWLGGVTPGVPQATLSGTGDILLEPGAGDSPFNWHVREWDGSRWHVRVLPGQVRTLRYNPARVPLVVVSAVNRLGQEGAPAWVVGEHVHAD